jgi:hypothetical protein
MPDTKKCEYFSTKVENITQKLLRKVFDHILIKTSTEFAARVNTFASVTFTAHLAPSP